jgi:mRNA interferase RelE/StbE
VRYTVEIAPAVLKTLKRLSRTDQVRLYAKIESLGEDPRPHGYKDLVGFKNFYRIRVGQYRIIYQIFDNILIVSVVELMTRSTGYK